MQFAEGYGTPNLINFAVNQPLGTYDYGIRKYDWQIGGGLFVETKVLGEYGVLTLKDDNTTASLVLDSTASNIDSSWIDAVGVSMKQGWNGMLSNEYLKELRSNLGLKLNVKSNRLDQVYKDLAKEIFELNHNGQISQMMMDNPHIEPKVPAVNRYCWELSFNKQFSKSVNEFINNQYSRGRYVTFSQFKKDFFKTFEEYLWRDDVEDVLYALESNRKIDLKIEGGRIVKIKVL